jgi:DNA repair protein RadA/Sms
LEEVLGNLEEHKPDLAVVDSIQTLYDDALSAEAGSVAQIRNCTRRLTEWAKDRQVPVILSGHVTKSGDIAGPRVLEHMVDVVLYMEGESVNSWRLLRTVKNRFGSTNDVGVFEMTGHGLLDVEDPSRTFLAERMDGAVGSVIVSTQEGSRPLLVEIQALTTPSVLPSPRRVATGIDFGRLLLVCAVLTRRVGIALSNQDIVVNVAGGLRVSEPAVDLGLALAIASSFLDRPVRADMAALGEVGLSGEIRMVPQLDRRLREIARLGLKQCLVPGAAGAGSSEPDMPRGLQTLPVYKLADAVRTCFPRGDRRTAQTSTA